jgi:hypothetical protein
MIRRKIAPGPPGIVLDPVEDGMCFEHRMALFLSEMVRTRPKINQILSP